MNFDKNTAANKVLPQWGVKCFYETFVLKQTVVHLLNFGAENPPLRQYPNRKRLYDKLVPKLFKMIDSKTINTITKYCIDNLDFEKSGIGWEYYYASMPLCVVDSVFSIGVLYEGVTNVISRISNHYKIEARAKRKHTLPEIKNQISTSEFLKLLELSPITLLASDIFKNRQRTSTKNGILKVEAVIKFLKVLKDFNIEYYQDIAKVINNESFDFCIKSIPGQKSGISMKYFFMLAGSKNLIKPDRMVIRFLQNASGKKFNLEDCQTVLSAVALQLNEKEFKVTPQLVDNAIWNYQRNL